MSFARQRHRLAAPARPTQPAVAGHARPLPHLAVGGDAAADAGERGDSLLRAFPGQLPDGEGARRGVGGRGPAAMERTGLLRARAATCTKPRWRSARNGFPTTAETIAELPGVGRSTAAAIAVFAYGERAAILDGNVKRVLSRRYGVARQRTLASGRAPAAAKRDLETYTQGLMDLGATVCKRVPDCGTCPVKARCVARKTGRIAELPAPRAKKALPWKQASWFVFIHQGKILLERRPSPGIWGGLWCFPERRPSRCRVNAQAAGDRAWLHPFPPAHPAASLRGCSDRNQDCGWTWTTRGARRSRRLSEICYTNCRESRRHAAVPGDSGGRARCENAHTSEGRSR